MVDWLGPCQNKLGKPRLMTPCKVPIPASLSHLAFIVKPSRPVTFIPTFASGEPKGDSKPVAKMMTSTGYSSPAAKMPFSVNVSTPRPFVSITCTFGRLRVGK